VRPLRLAQTALVTAVAVLAFPALASAAVGCVFGGTTATISMTAAGDAGSVSVGTGVNLGRIMVGITACGA